MLEKTAMRDIFEPRRDPAKSIYLAFQAEAANRKGRPVDQWARIERDAVHRESIHQAQKMGLRSPTVEEVDAAERYARGSVDYGAKWAYQLDHLMHSPPVDSH